MQPLPYRRVLTDAEAANRRETLERTFGLAGKSWHPMITRDIPPGVLIVRQEAFWHGPGVEHVQTALRKAGTRRVTELREWGAEYQLDLAWFAPRYDGAEGVWSDDGLTWIAFASHEGTVAFGRVPPTLRLLHRHGLRFNLSSPHRVGMSGRPAQPLVVAEA
jgi:hypothetical protein